MAKNKKKKVVVTTKQEAIGKTALKKVASISKKSDNDLLFGRKNYTYILIGVGLIALGMILMMGGHMPSPDVWDESLIYSPIRTVVSPILILAGLTMQFFAIFTKK